MSPQRSKWHGGGRSSFEARARARAPQDDGGESSVCGTFKQRRPPAALAFYDFKQPIIFPRRNAPGL